MKTIQGDISDLVSEGLCDVIVHSCDCSCTMGAGVARTIQKEFPEAYVADLKTAKGDPAKLGTFSSATIAAGESSVCIVNAYTQVDWSHKSYEEESEALREVLRQVKQEFSGQKIALPLLSSQFSQLQWAQVIEVIEVELAGENHFLIEHIPHFEEE